MKSEYIDKSKIKAYKGKELNHICCTHALMLLYCNKNNILLISINYELQLLLHSSISNLIQYSFSKYNE